VKDYGAKADGKTMDTDGINSAIDAAAAAGGGVVLFPSGTYLSGSIHLKSNITLFLQRGSIIEASAKVGYYDVAELNSSDLYQDFGHSHWHTGLIWGENLSDISIEGYGIIFGKGLSRNRKSDNLPVGMADKVIALKNCRNVVLRDFSILHGGHVGILTTGINNLSIQNLRIDTNRDGINVDGCKNVKISGCSINSPFNDAICLKSSYALGYRMATEDVIISDCMVTGGYREGTLLDGTFELLDSTERPQSPTGRIKIGSESNGDFRNIVINNCIFNYCRGIAIQGVDGGTIEDVSISNITMRNLTGPPLFLRLGARLRGPAGSTVGSLRRININNLVAFDAPAEIGCVITGIPGHYIEDISIANTMIVFKGGGSKEDSGISPPEKEDSYPEINVFGKMPSYGFFVRHIKGLVLNNLKMSFEVPDARPPFVLEDVENAHFWGIQVKRINDVPWFILKNVSDFSVKLSPEIKDTVVELTKNNDIY